MDGGLVMSTCYFSMVKMWFVIVYTSAAADPCFSNLSELISWGFGNTWSLSSRACDFFGAKALTHAFWWRFNPIQWIILVIGDRWAWDYLTPKRRQGLYLLYKRVFSCQLGWLYTTYHPPQEPEESIQPRVFTHSLTPMDRLNRLKPTKHSLLEL